MTDPADIRGVRRIVIVSRANGTSGLLVGLLVLAISVTYRDWRAAAAATGLCLGAAVELLGSRLARLRKKAARTLLVASQCIALASVMMLTFHLISTFSPVAALEWMPRLVRDYVTSRVPDPESAAMLVAISFNTGMACLALTALAYEGFMAMFYNRSAPVLPRTPDSPPPVLKT